MPTVLYRCESASRVLGAPLVRINRREPEGRRGTMSFADGALAVLQRLDALVSR